MTPPPTKYPIVLIKCFSSCWYVIVSLFWGAIFFPSGLFQQFIPQKKAIGMSLWMPAGHQNSQQPAKLVHFCRPSGHLGNTNTEQVVAWWWHPVASCRSWTCYIANYMLVNIIFTSSYDVDAPRMTMYAVFVTIIANEQARTYWRPMIFPEQGGSMFHDWRWPCL